MPNAIKYTAGTETLALKKGNFYIGTGDVGKGPTSTTGYFDGVSPASGGYVIYVRNSAGRNLIYGAPNDSQLILITNRIAGTSYTTVNECLVYFAGQNDKVVVNIDYPPVVTNGLVLYLDAGFTPSYPRSTTTWTDLSANGNNCTLINGPTYSTSQGGGIKFDATDDYATIPDSNSLDLTELTISLWFNRGDILTLAAGDQQNFFLKGNTAAAGGDQICPAVRLFGPTGGGEYSWDAGSLGGGNGNIVPPSQVLFANQWYNLVFTHVSTNAPIPYLNGVKQTNWTVTNASNPLVPNNFIATISGDGARTNPATRAATFNGIMSIVQLYNRALSETEVLQNWNVLSSRFFENIVRTGLTFYLDPGYPNCYPGTGTTINNLSGNNTGSLNNGTAYSSSNGGTFIFDGTNDTITFSDNSAFQLSGPGTVSFWCKFVTTAQRCVGPQMLASAADSDGAWAIAIRANRSVNFEIYPAGAINDTPFTLSEAELPLDTWGMLTCVSTTTGCDGYWNGVYRGSIGYPFPPASTYSGTNSFRILDRGTLGPMMIYNRSLSASEVLQNYNAQKGRFIFVTDSLVMNLNAGNTSSYPGSGTLWTDLSGQNNNATLVGGPTFSSSNGGVISFDGTDDGGQWASGGAITANLNTWYNDTTRTLQMWINFSNLNQGLLQSITSLGDDEVQYGFAIFNSRWAMFSNSLYATVGNALSTNTWYFVTLLRTGQTSWTIYQGTTNIGNVTQFAGISSFGGDYQFQLMCNGYGSHKQGTVGQVLFYSKVLSASEIENNYEATKSRFGL
jgi:hypothetical protein